MELFNLLRSSISGEKLSAKVRDSISSEQLQSLLILAHKHDLGHLLAWGLKQNGLIPKTDTSAEKHIFKAIYRYEQMSYEYENVCNALEKAHIPFIPLKGSVIRSYYPEPWMRTSCDIDILVHRQDSEKAMALLIDEYKYTYHDKGPHDISLFSPGQVHIELHYDLIEEGRANCSTEILTKVWDTATVRDGFSFWYEMTDEMFYFYHIAHMAKHVEEGGCGIRSFLDLWILDNIEHAATEKRNELLEKGGLLKFADAARGLSQVWFENAEYDSVSKQMEDYILRGGVYGSDENRIIVQQQKQGGRIKYALSKIFVPYDVIKFHYPILQKHRWLTPVMEIRRWCKLIFCGHAKRTINELKYNQNVTRDAADNTKKFMESIGL